MSMRLSIVPIVGTGATAEDARRPKYFADGGIVPAISWGGTDYGFEPQMFVAADLDATNLAFLQAQPDAYVIPEDLDQTLTGGQVSGVQVYLEAMNLPANWLTTSYTWREVVRIIVGIFRFMARFAVIFNQATGTNAPLFTGGVNLSRTYSTLSAAVRTALAATATDMALDQSTVTGSTTVRQLLGLIGSQMALRQQSIGSYTDI